MSPKDDVPTQFARIITAVKQLDPNCIVIFDPDAKRNHLRFRIENSSGVILTSAHPENHVSVISDWTDEQLLGTIKALTGNRL